MVLWVAMVLFVSTLSFLWFLWVDSVWLIEFSLISLFGTSASFIFIFDFFSFFFSTVVLFVSTIIFFFGQYYMDSDMFQKGFSLLLSLFVLSMLFLINSPNLLCLMLGWDGLGLVSYLLVVYYMSFSSSAAGMLTFLMNRVGDVFFIFSLGLMFYLGSWSFNSFKDASLLLAGACIVTFITKSAQIPFSAWLPAAMAAPTPVSSLVHSSTLVTAGVFLLVRFSFITMGGYFLLFFLSLATMLMAGVAAIFEWDMKKIIALSTLSQLGFMVFSISLGLYYFSFFHLVCHALFKASLFMCSGVMIHSSDGEQDFRNATKFLKVAPMVVASVLVSMMCLCGLPFLSGFLSKDFILDSSNFSVFFYFVYLVAVFLTFLYTLRFCFYSFFMSLTLKAKLVKIYETVVYVYFPAWLFTFAGVFVGMWWGEVVNSFTYFSFFSYVWKGFYLFFFLGGVLSYFLVFYWGDGSMMAKSFISSMWFQTKVMTSRLFNTVSGSVGVSYFVSQGWLEVLGPQKIFMTILKFSHFGLREQSFFFLVCILSFLGLVFVLG